jgi:hypothetical protein
VKWVRENLHRSVSLVQQTITSCVRLVSHWSSALKTNNYIRNHSSRNIQQFSVPCIKKDTTGELLRRKSGSERLTGKSLWNGSEKISIYMILFLIDFNVVCPMYGCVVVLK